MSQAEVESSNNDLMDKLALEDEENGDAEDDDPKDDSVPDSGTKSNKNKKKKKKKSAAQKAAAQQSTNGTTETPAAAGQSEATSNNTSSPKKSSKGSKKAPLVQTVPPSIPIKDLFPNQDFPIGEIMDHPAIDGCGDEGPNTMRSLINLVLNNRKTAINRIMNEEKKALDSANLDVYREVRLAAEAHRQTRKYMQEYIKPGMTMIHIW